MWMFVARRQSNWILPLIFTLACFLLGKIANAQDLQQTEYKQISASEAKFISNADASLKLPIALSGVVTCVPQGWKGFFLEDDSGGVYCEPKDAEAEASFWPVRVGEKVELKGVTAPGHRNSFVAVSSITSRKPGTLPKPTIRTIRNTIDDRIDADFVRLRGHIVGLVNIAGQMEYGLLAEGVEAEVVHAGFRVDPKVYDHAEVEICGIVIPQETNARRIKIIVPELSCFKMIATHLEVLESTKVSTVRDLLERDVDINPIVRLSGEIFSQSKDETWLVENGFGIAWMSKGNLLPEGTRHVELIGILKQAGARRWIAYGTTLATTNVENESKVANHFLPSEVIGKTNQIVSLNATFWDLNAFDSDLVLSFDLGNAKLTGRLLDQTDVLKLNDLQRGAEYQVTGLLTSASIDGVEAPFLLIRSLSDVVQVSGPPWPVKFTLYIVSLLTAGLAVGLVTSVYCWRQASTAKQRLELARNDLHLSNENLEKRVADRTLQLDTINRRLTDEATARLLVECEQKETLASLEDAQSLAQIGSFVWNATNSTATWSRQCFLIHGLDPQECPPHLEEYCNRVSEEDRPAFKHYLQRAATSSDREEFRYRIKLPNEEIRWVRSLIKSTYSPDRSSLSFEGIIQNVTDQVQAEEQLRQSVKMDVAGHLAGGIAHDLNNTLAIVKMNCYLIQAELEGQSLGPSICEHLAAIETASEKSALLTRQLLTFSRRQIIRPVVLNVNSTIQGFRTLLSKLVDNRVSLEFQLTNEISHVRLDQGQLEQVLMNLVLNAHDAISGSGTIQVRTRNVSITGESDYGNWILQPKAGDFVSLSVTDNGSGIDSDCLSKVFEPFYSTKGPEKGTGLGLAVVHGIVRQNNGGLRVESQLNQFTSFEILIPIAHEVDSEKVSDFPQVDALPLFETIKARATRNETILLVDDDSAVGSHMEHVLKRLGYTVKTISTAQEALKLIREGAKDFQLLITDYSMPQMSGVELAKQIHQHLPSLPVILMSGFLNEEAFRSLPLGLEPIFIQKPFTIQELATSIRTATQRIDTAHQVMPSTVQERNRVLS